MEMTEQSPHPRRRPPAFTPRFTLALLYLAVFFVLFSFLQVLPDLIDILGEMPPGPAQEAAAAEAAQKRTHPPTSMALALLTVGLGAYFQVLPGLRESRER